MPSPTIRDVAREAGVSTATVSYVLNNTRRVGEETRRKVLEAAMRLGYRANITARNLQASETRLLGYTWRPAPLDMFNPILDTFLNAISQSAQHHGYRILTFPTETLAKELETYQEMMLIGQVDGFILSNTSATDPRVRFLLDAGFPFVAFGRSSDEETFPWVDVDGTAGEEQATTHLIQRGHRRIACLAWPEASLSGQHRLAGYRKAMQEHGLAIQEEWVMRIENKHDAAYQAARRLLALPAERRPSAIVTMSDLMAIGVMNAAGDAGLEVGKDLAVVGFDDASITRFLRPPLSSVQQPIAEVGEKLITMLVNICQGRDLGVQHYLLQPKLIVRASSAAPYNDSTPPS